MNRRPAQLAGFALVVFALLAAGCSSDSAETTTSAATTETTTAAADSTTATTAATTTTAAAAEEQAESTDCALGADDAAIPSIGRTGKSAVATGLVPESLDERDVGSAIRQIIESGDLCAEHLVALYNDNDPPGDLSPEMQSAIEMVVADLGG